MNFAVQLMIILCFSFRTGYADLQDLTVVYNAYVNTPSDINEHIPVVRQLAKECATVLELGVRDMVTTWGFLQGLAESKGPHRTYMGLDLHHPPLEKFLLAKLLAKSQDIAFNFQIGNDLKIEPPECDLLFIDTYHTYCHLTEELERFAPHTHKYIALHDTSPPFGYEDQPNYYNLPDEYSAWIDRTKKGLWPAVVDFLARHSDEWILQERRFNNHGFTVLKRISKK